MPSYSIVAEFFPRLLGLIYFFAFGAFLFQIRGLIGRNGILPLSEYLNKLKTYYPSKRFFYAPTLFWINSSNTALMLLTAAGTLLSICLIAGFFPSFVLFLLFILYLSIVSAGQDFLSFGWEGFLLEVTVQAFLISLTPIPNVVAWLSINFLLFRFHIMAGAVKLQSQDKFWRNLTALFYHYQTQPLPNTIAWYIHKLPLIFHQLSAALMFIIELIVPFGIFATEEIRAYTFGAFFSLQFFIWLTGNFSFLNHLTVIFSTILLSDHMLMGIITPSNTLTPTSVPLTIFISILASSLLVLQLIRFWHHFFPNLTFEKILYWISPFHIANRYGIFAVMTTKRHEVIVEGSDDGHQWKEYTFQYKPSETNRRPRRISPYQPRIDWQAWFLPFSDYRTAGWFQKFLVHLLQGTPDVLALLRGNPFPVKPPLYIRSVLYDYQFSNFKEKKEKGIWCKS